MAWLVSKANNLCFVLDLLGVFVRATSIQSGFGQTVADTSLELLLSGIRFDFNLLVRILYRFYLNFLTVLRLNLVFSSLEKLDNLHLYFFHYFFVQLANLFAFQYTSLSIFSENFGCVAKLAADFTKEIHSDFILSHTLTQLENVIPIFLSDLSYSLLNFLSGSLNFLGKS